MEKEGKQDSELGVFKKLTRSRGEKLIKRGESMRTEQARQDGTGYRDLDTR